ncbi:MAG: hypothetical protein IJ776_07860 [Paludibacteraceae bacterium]|nr:hypothetical protein [Paludibacteraceae bacterium]
MMLFSAPLSIVAQNSTSSPYSRFGLGELNDNVPGALRAMGGVGTGMRDKRVINPSQPASFSVVDSTTFMFDLGLSAMWSNYGDATGTRNKANGNLEYLTMQMPFFWKYIGFSVGVLPYSQVGYDLTDSVKNVPHRYSKTYSGQGGITQVYGGLSFNIVNWVALGASVYYMFGNTVNNRVLTFSETTLSSVSQTTTLRVSDVRFRYGAQFFHTFAEKHSVVLGATFENKSKFNAKLTTLETVTSDTIPLGDNEYDLPMMYSVGASYTYANRLTIGADYTMTDWSNALYKSEKGALRSRMKISVGAEYCHNPYGKRYIERMPFRLGMNISDSYVKSITAKDFSVSLGVGFPLRNVATVINTSLEYGHRGTTGVLQENYLRLTINASISENWFFKRRL